MNLPHAKRYASLGYAIRREAWGSSKWLSLVACHTWLLHEGDQTHVVRAGEVSKEDHLATDWTMDWEVAEGEDPPNCQRPIIPDPGPYCIEDPTDALFRPSCKPFRPRIERQPKVSTLTQLPPPVLPEPEDPLPEPSSGNFT